MRSKVTDVDVIVDANKTAPDIGCCAHCGEVMQLRYDDDNATMRIAHGGTVCSDWNQGGRIYFGRATTMHPETVVATATAYEAARREKHRDN